MGCLSNRNVTLRAVGGGGHLRFDAVVWHGTLLLLRLAEGSRAGPVKGTTAGLLHSFILCVVSTTPGAWQAAGQLYTQ